MADVYDILLNAEDNDLQDKDGDLVIGESTKQHQGHLLFAQKGDLRPAPFLGVGVENELLNDDGALDLTHEVQKNFELDGMQVNSIKIISAEEIDIDANY